MVDCGTMLAERPNKCLQLAVAGRSRGAWRSKTLRFFRQVCDNEEGSGCGGAGANERGNFTAVEQWLQGHGVFFCVYGVRGASEVACGAWTGKWLLGAAHGRCMGALAWCEVDGHVTRVVDSDNALSSTVPVRAWETAPWVRGTAGAPKKSKRGAHLKGKGNEVAARGREAQQSMREYGALGSGERGSGGRL